MMKVGDVWHKNVYFNSTLFVIHLTEIVRALINQDVATQVFFTLLLGVPKVRYIYFMKSHHCFLNFGCQRKLYALS